ncbi:hypothetical protein [Dactylosporangium sp. CA-139066]|uniref:hypothetical protein n=1 Tax=Dactylosporangium sp. CA-139066 TaxID=3239930 RepID=UPI003D920C7D
MEAVAVADGSPRYTLFGHGDAVTAAEDRTVRVWDLATGECRHVLSGHKEKLSALAVSADGRTARATARRSGQQLRARRRSGGRRVDPGRLPIVVGT